MKLLANIAKSPLPAIPREGMQRNVRSAAHMLERAGFTVKHEGRGCYQYTRVFLRGRDLHGQMSGSGLIAFAAGVQAGRTL